MELGSVDVFRATYEGILIICQVKSNGVPYMQILDRPSLLLPKFTAMQRRRLIGLKCFELVFDWRGSILNQREARFLQNLLHILDVQSVEICSRSSKPILEKIFSLAMSTRGINSEKQYTEFSKHFRLLGMNLREFKTDIDTSFFYVCKYSIKHNVLPNLVSLTLCRIETDLVPVIFCLADEPFCNQLKVLDLSYSSKYLSQARSWVLSKYIFSVQSQILLAMSFYISKATSFSLLVNSLLLSQENLQCNSVFTFNYGNIMVSRQVDRCEVISEGAFSYDHGILRKELKNN
eukprot:snap_masked-scaffold_98-processed-gene-0.5-mRNA-1 protein AED:1.00 eAED:1.00 QI:0/0/0/0/1/1/2/0/290